MKTVMEKLNPNLMVKDIRETVEFYINILGFELVMAVSETQDGMDTELQDDKKYVWAQVKNGNVEIMLQEEESLQEALSNCKIGASVSFYIETENVEGFYNEL